MFRISDTETLADIKPRIQRTLGVSDEEFAKWKFSINFSLRPPDYLEDADNIAAKIRNAPNLYNSNHDQQYLGLEHTDAHPHRHRHHTSRYHNLIFLQVQVIFLHQCLACPCHETFVYEMDMVSGVMSMQVDSLREAREDIQLIGCSLLALTASLQIELLSDADSSFCKSCMRLRLDVQCCRLHVQYNGPGFEMLICVVCGVALYC